MGQGIVVQNGQHVGYAHAIVGAQSGALGPQPAVLDVQLQGVFAEIVVLSRVAGAHHVDVGLEQHGRPILVSGRGRLIDDHIAHLVLQMMQSVFFGPCNQIVAVGLLVEGSVGNAGHLLQIFVIRYIGIQNGIHSQATSFPMPLII